METHYHATVFDGNTKLDGVTQFSCYLSSSVDVHLLFIGVHVTSIIHYSLKEGSVISMIRSNAFGVSL